MSEALHQLSWAGRLLAVSAGAFLIAWFVRRRGWWGAPFAALGGMALMLGLTIPLFFLRPQPAAKDVLLFQGVRYERWSDRAPAYRVIHLVTVDLTTPGLRVLVTPPEPIETEELRFELPARTTSGFLRDFDLQLAVNANYFYPVFSYGSFHYYPRVGDGVKVVGRAISSGQFYGQREDAGMVSLWFFDGRAEVSAEALPGQHAVSGYRLVRDGGLPPAVARSTHAEPRMAVGVNGAGDTLMLLVVDGRQPYYSDGASLKFIAELLISRGAHDGLLLDGGGSTSMVVRGPDGRPKVLNTPVHGRIPPGYERPVANHIGFGGLRPAR